VARIPQLQGLLRYICANGFEHHVAINPARVAAVVEEAFTRYLGWDVYNHDSELAIHDRERAVGDRERAVRDHDRAVRNRERAGAAGPRA
jgi:hypothetical protein